MKAMVLKQITNLRENHAPLEYITLPDPEPAEKEILIRVSVCGVCHTELDEIEGRTPPSRFPMVLGHQVVGRVERNGPGATRFRAGERVGVAWIFWADGTCKFCREGNENLCVNFKATGRDAFGGYAQYMKVREDFAYRIPDVFSDAQAAPLLCAGAVGYRALRLAELRDGENLGLAGFGSSNSLVLLAARQNYPHSRTFVFSRNAKERAYAQELGATWAGGFEEQPPEKLDAIIDTTPVWKPVVQALGNLEPAGRLVVNAIRKEIADKDYLLNLDYARDLWLEKEIKSVANVARRDVEEFLAVAAQVPIKPEIQEFPLQEANQALVELKAGGIRGSKVLRIG